jgi:hypothetical protein
VEASAGRRTIGTDDRRTRGGAAEADYVVVEIGEMKGLPIFQADAGSSKYGGG